MQTQSALRIRRQRVVGNGPRRVDLSIRARIERLSNLASAMVDTTEELEAFAYQLEESSFECPMDFYPLVRHFESELIRSALIRTDGKQRQAAWLLGMKVTTLRAV